jgi:predicted esterase
MKKNIATFLLLITSALAFGEIISIPNQNMGFFYPKEDTQTIYRSNIDSKAVLIFLPGGPGSFGTEPGKPELDRFFALTSISKGINAGLKLDFVFMDSPYVLSPPARDNLSIRKTKDHIDRIKKVVEVYAEKTKKPIWLIGHSNGAYSLASFLNQEPDNQKKIAGAIFSSGRNEKSLSGEFKLPILILHHENDPCQHTTYSASTSFYNDVKKQNLGKTELFTVTGGSSSGDPCLGISSQHMFAGSYDQVEKEIIKFISEN